MSSFFRRPRSPICFYCQSFVNPAPQNLRLFQCPNCACWNRFDTNGEIVSDEPAMHDENLNSNSFAKRASPNKNHLPSTYSKGLFCHTCQTNQTLLVNLLSNYLPSPENPMHEHRLSSLQDYTYSLQTRYPPVCTECLPAVEDEIWRKNNMARTRALGGALKKGRDQEMERTGERAPGRQQSSKDLLIWRFRGCLWLLCQLVSLGYNASGAFDLQFPPTLRALAPFAPALALLSLTWSFWDPTYSLSRRSHQQGLQVRISGRQAYIRSQLTLWISRAITSVLVFCSWFRTCSDIPGLSDTFPKIDKRRQQAWFGSCMALELSVLVYSYFSIRIHQPAAVRLIDTTTHLSTHLDSDSVSSFTHPKVGKYGLENSSQLITSAAITTPSEPDLFATLSLSSNPVISTYAANPIFGRPSLYAPEKSNQISNPNRIYDNTGNPDAMDWEPSVIPSDVRSTGAREEDDGTWLRPQLFFPPEQPTGLESLLMRTCLMDDDGTALTQLSGRRGKEDRGQEVHWSWSWVYVLSMVPVFVLVVFLWNSRE